MTGEALGRYCSGIMDVTCFRVYVLGKLGPNSDNKVTLCWERAGPKLRQGIPFCVGSRLGPDSNKTVGFKGKSYMK